MKDKITKQLKEFYPNARVSEIKEIRYKDGIFVGQVDINNKNVIVKFFEKHEHAIEIENYALLNKLNVPTPIIFNTSKNLIVMENLNLNPNYHLATEKDLQNEKTIKNLARWYKKLHNAGKQINLDNFYSELDFINKENLTNLISIIPDCKNLELMINNIDAIENKIKSLNLTITYNDFDRENMIAGDELSMMYDHNKLGKGLAYFDIKNVCFMLSPEMQKAFIEEYGNVNEIEKIARNLAAQKGIDFDKEFNVFRKNIWKDWYFRA